MDNFFKLLTDIQIISLIYLAIHIKIDILCINYGFIHSDMIKFRKLEVQFSGHFF